MPKVNLNPEHKALEVADGEIRAALARSHLDYKKVMSVCRFSTTAYYNRDQDVGMYRLHELQQIAKKTNMDPLQAASIVLGRRVTVEEVMK